MAEVKLSRQTRKTSGISRWLHTTTYPIRGVDVLICSPVRSLFHDGVGCVDGMPPDGDHPSHEGKRGESHRSWLTLGAFSECVGDLPSVLWQWVISLALDGGSSFPMPYMG